MKRVLMSMFAIVLIMMATSCEKNDIPVVTLQTTVTANVDGFTIDVLGGSSPYTYQVFKPGAYTTETWMFDTKENVITGLQANTTYWLVVWDSKSNSNELGGFTTLVE
jgi:hypothetical protein